MRGATAIVIVILAFSFGSDLTLAQTGGRWDDWLYSIHMFDARAGWAVDAEGWNGSVAKGAAQSVVRTIDGGLHWKDVTPPDPPGHKIARGAYGFRVNWTSSLVASVAAVEDTTVYPSSPPTWLFRTADGGRTWRAARAPVAGPFQFINARDGWMLASGLPGMGSAEAEIYRSTNGGETWNKLASTRFVGLGPQIAFLNATTGWIIPGSIDKPEWIYLSVTYDGGHTWQEQKLPLPPQTKPQFANVLPLRFFTERDGVLPVSIHNDSQSGIVLFLTYDGGASWKHTAVAPVKSFLDPTAFADVDHGWLTSDDVLCVTADGGRQWTKIQPGPPFVSVDQFDFISPKIGWAAGWAGNPAFLLKTVDGGHTWANLPYTVSRR